MILGYPNEDDLARKGCVQDRQHANCAQKGSPLFHSSPPKKERLLFYTMLLYSVVSQVTQDPFFLFYLDDALCSSVRFQMQAGNLHAEIRCRIIVTK